MRRSGADMFFLRLFETASDAGLDPEDMKEIPGSARALHTFRFDDAGDIEVCVFKATERFELRRAFLPFEKITQRYRHAVGVIKVPNEGFFSQIMTSRSGSRKGRARRSTASTTLKTALFAPMPRAKTAMTMKRKHRRLAQDARGVTQIKQKRLHGFLSQERSGRRHQPRRR